VDDAIPLRVGDFTLLLPPEHRLPQIRAHMPTYDAHLGWIIAEIGRSDPGGYFIDIGANIGDTAAILRSAAPNPLLCVEGSAAFLPYLQENVRQLPGHVTVLDAFVAVDEIAAAGLGYKAHSGSGHFTSGPALKGGERFVRVAELARMADEAGAALALFKTDTDGLDAFILRDYLRLHRDAAVLFFECDEAATPAAHGRDAWDGNFAALRARGYSLIVYDNHGLPMLFAPAEHSEMTEDLRFYVRRQQAAGAVRVHYLDIWAFPPSRRAVFDTLREGRERLFT
jgi:FkbM family methyltransferase